MHDVTELAQTQSLRDIIIALINLEMASTHLYAFCSLTVI